MVKELYKVVVASKRK